MKRGKHHSLEPKVKAQAKWLESLEGVTAVIVARSESCRHKFAPGTIRIKAEVQAGFKCTGYGGFGITDIFLYVKPPYRASVRKALEARNAP